MRAGRTSHMFEADEPIPKIELAGRWASDKSMAAYIQETEAVQGLLSLPQSSIKQMESVATLLNFVAVPPSAPFVSLAAPPRTHFDDGGLSC